MENNSGLIKGPSHEGGGVTITVAPTSTPIIAEGNEYNICRSGYESPEIYNFVQKTNKEILDEIHQKESCKYVPNQANSGDFIICKLVVQDETRKDRSGTVKAILNEMQSEKSCNVSNGSDNMATGGSVTDCPCEHTFGDLVWDECFWWVLLYNHAEPENVEVPNNEPQPPAPPQFPPIQQPIASVHNV